MPVFKNYQKRNAESADNNDADDKVLTTELMSAVEEQYCLEVWLRSFTTLSDRGITLVLAHRNMTS